MLFYSCSESLSKYDLINKNEHLLDDSIIIWLVKFPVKMEISSDMLELLSSEERVRAESFRHLEDGQRYVYTHVLVRTILGKCIGQDPSRIQFSRNPFGKPELKNSPQLRFNTSYSSSFLAFAVSKGIDIGIDIEHCASIANLDGVAAEIMNQQEYKDYLFLGDCERQRFFYRHWVRKEAIVKAKGTGLNEDLRNFSFHSPLPGGLESTYVSDKRNGKKKWYIKDFNIDDYHIGALCLEKKIETVIFKYDMFEHILKFRQL